jgi:hypothetical protein
MSNQELEIPPSATMEEKIDLILFYLADISKKQGIIVKLEEKITVLKSPRQPPRRPPFLLFARR